MFAGGWLCRYEDGEVGPLVDRRIRDVAGGNWGGRGFVDDSALLGEDADSFGENEGEEEDGASALFGGVGDARSTPEEEEEEGNDNDDDAYSESGFGEQDNLRSPAANVGDDDSAYDDGDGGFNDSLPFEAASPAAAAAAAAATVRVRRQAGDSAAGQRRGRESKTAPGNNLGWLSNRVILSDGYMPRCRVRFQL